MNSSLSDIINCAIDFRISTFGSALNDSQSAIRILTSNEGIPDLTIDRYGHAVVFHEYNADRANSLELFRGLIPILKQRLNSEYFVIKSFYPDRSNLLPRFNQSNFIGNVPPPETILIIENGLRFLIYPNDGFCTGLFLDQRNNRAQLQSLCKPGNRVLNLFSYTGSFSVFCAKNGAFTTSVDISKRALSRTKANFEHNGINLDRHTFLCRDSISSLEGFTKKGVTFDLVIVDPPSFSRTNGTVFSIQTDFLTLLELALKCTAKGGHLFFSTNFSKFIDSGIPPLPPVREVTPLPSAPIPMDFSKGKKTVRSMLWRVC